MMIFVALATRVAYGESKVQLETVAQIDSSLEANEIVDFPTFSWTTDFKEDVALSDHYSEYLLAGISLSLLSTDS